MMRWLGLSLILVASSFALAQERKGKQAEIVEGGPESFSLEPFGRTQRSVICVAGREARAVAIGDGRTAIAIYAYDPRGHCVAYDDEPSGFIDDRVVAWTPVVSGLFDVQYRNLGPKSNRVEAVAR